MTINNKAAKRITLLGSTGSVGVNTLDLIRLNPDRFDVVALTAGKDVDALIFQAREFRPEMAVIADPSGYQALADGLRDLNITVAAGPEALIVAAELPSDLALAAIVGAAGLPATLAAVQTCSTVALANKECLVCAGDLFMEAVRRNGTTLLPVDSEHSAIFQVFDAENVQSVERIIL
ncbi:MAG: 1-deoxy-D-xylulose-5-phosphate reductoisomerase, partial [Rhodospirillales bacterium]